MATIHRTTMTPGKLALLGAWLPGRPWYSGAAAPELSKAGGYRLDDPSGEVGVEFMFVADQSGSDPKIYQVPVSYRGAPLAGADHALIGTSEHGVLGRRWVYDGVHDPVVVALLLDLLRGRAEPQAQGESNTADPSVLVGPMPSPLGAVVGSAVQDDGARATDIAIETEATSGSTVTQVLVRLIRVLQAADIGAAAADVVHPGSVSGNWQLPDGTAIHGPFAFAITAD